mmetsp:Transcript_70984/g.152966  ORF Transcript_70984/g.152966 Transcript_70984/m.152966 type:complete len:436 (-) Transcript_70984:43-1350(-)
MLLPQAAPVTAVGPHCHPLLLEDHLVEAVHLLRRADGQGAALVHGLDLQVQDAVAAHAVRGLAAGHLHEAAEGGGLEGQAQLGGRGLGRGVGEDALQLGELLAHVRHEAAGVAEGVLVLHVVVQEVLVALDLLRGAHVRRREDLGLLLDHDLVAGADPLVARAEGELVDAVVQGHEAGGAGAVQDHEAHHLVAARGANEARRLVPDAHDGADRPVVVDDGAAVKRVPAEDVLAVRVGLHDHRLLLGGGLAHKLAALCEVPEQVVRDHVHGELRVAEGVGGVVHGHEVHAEGLGDLDAGGEQLLHHGLQLGVLQGLGEHLLHGVVLVLGHGVRVEGGVRGAVGRVLLRLAGGARRAALGREAGGAEAEGGRGGRQGGALGGLGRGGLRGDAGGRRPQGGGAALGGRHEGEGAGGRGTGREHRHAAHLLGRGHRAHL